MDEAIYFDPTWEMLKKVPVTFDWVEFKGKPVVAQVNFEASRKAKRPMMDISACMTKAINQSIEFTTQWDKSKFKPSKNGFSKW